MCSTTRFASCYAHAGHFTQLVWADSTKVGCGIGYASRKFDRWVGGCKVRQSVGGGVWETGNLSYFPLQSLGGVNVKQIPAT